MRTAVIGCGLTGTRRAEQAAAHSASRLVAVVDRDAGRAAALADRLGAEPLDTWQDVLDRDDIDAVVVSTPTGLFADIGCRALAAGKHVLIEKPMGRGLEDARRLAAAAAAARGTFRVGFNHRFHPALAQARTLVASGELGGVLSIRARYGHGSRPGCEHEWRADPAQAGGGELTDQGVHVTDLIHWFAGLPEEAFCYLQTAFWPIQPLEDNGFGLFRYADGRVAQLHVSMTQWKNLFSFEVFCEGGLVQIEGLGGSYGIERLLVARRRATGGVPDQDEQEFPGDDTSWACEWSDFVAAAHGGGTGHGDAAAGLAAMRMVDALYRSASLGAPVRL